MLNGCERALDLGTRRSGRGGRGGPKFAQMRLCLDQNRRSARQSKSIPLRSALGPKLSKCRRKLGLTDHFEKRAVPVFGEIVSHGRREPFNLRKISGLQKIRPERDSALQPHQAAAFSDGLQNSH